MDAISKQLEIECADALSDIGISVPLLCIKIPFRKKPWVISVTMRRPTMGSLIKIARIHLSMGVTFEDMQKFTKEEEFEFIAKHGNKVAEIASLAILRNGLKVLLFGWLMKRIILWCVSDRHLMAVSRQFTPLFGTKAFENIIKSVEVANPLVPRMSH